LTLAFEGIKWKWQEKKVSTQTDPNNPSQQSSTTETDEGEMVLSGYHLNKSGEE